MLDYQKQVINAAIPKDIEAILIANGLWDDILNKKVPCCICGDLIDKDRIGALIVKDNGLSICCNNMDCVEQIRK